MLKSVLFCSTLAASALGSCSLLFATEQQDAGASFTENDADVSAESDADLGEILDASSHDAFVGQLCPVLPLGSMSCTSVSEPCEGLQCCTYHVTSEVLASCSSICSMVEGQCLTAHKGAEGLCSVDAEATCDVPIPRPLCVCKLLPTL